MKTKKERQRLERAATAFLFQHRLSVNGKPLNNGAVESTLQMVERELGPEAREYFTPAELEPPKT